VVGFSILNQEGALSGRTFRHRDCIIYYEVHDAGPPVLFFNGSGLTLESSAWLITALARTCRIAAHDQRGSASQECPTARTQWPTTQRTEPHCLMTSVGTDARSQASALEEW
jgi:pimeloyl-ACP methyl ester carboxylesterase